MDLNSHKPQFEKILEHFRAEIAAIRTGRAASSLVEGLTVEHYGGKYQLRELATISIPELKVILIQPWDKRTIPAIVKAIKESNLGLNPIADANGVRLVLPSLTEERRRELIKLLKQKTEETRIVIRRLRGEIWNDVQEKEKAGQIREGEKFKAKDDLQKIVDEYNQKVEELEKKKERELMTQ